MAEISAKVVKDLRDKTGAGMMDCKRALSDAEGDLDRAIELLRERGLAKAGKRGGRATSEGVVAVALDGATAGIVEVGCETDFVARTDEFLGLCNSLAGAVAADANHGSVEGLLEASLDGEKVADKVNAAISRLGENVVIKRAQRLSVDGPGVAGGYVHAGGKLGVVVALATEAPGPEVEATAKDVAMHIAAADPTPVAIDRDGVDADLLARERALFQTQAQQSGKPEKVIDKIVEGRVNKFLSEVCLVEQAYVKDPDRTIGDLLRDVGKSAGGDVSVGAYERFKLGEGDSGEA